MAKLSQTSLRLKALLFSYSSRVSGFNLCRERRILKFQAVVKIMEIGEILNFKQRLKLSRPANLKFQAIVKIVKTGES